MTNAGGIRAGEIVLFNAIFQCNKCGVKKVFLRDTKATVCKCGNDSYTFIAPAKSENVKL